MLRGRKNVETSHGRHRLPIAAILAQGLAVGLVTGLVGAGGGFLVVPALALLGGLSMPTAVGTALIVIAMNSIAGLAGHLLTGPIDWTLASAVTAAAVVGALVGVRLTAKFDPDVLRKGFGWLVLAMSSVILAEEIHPSVGIAMAALTAIAAAMTFAALGTPTARFVASPRGRPQAWARRDRRREYPRGYYGYSVSREERHPWLVTKTQSPRY